MDWHPQTILVGIDGSEGSTRAAAHAAAIARHWDARLLLVTVVRAPEGWWGIGGAPPAPEALAEALARGQKEILSEVTNQVDLEGINHETIEDLGDPAGRLIAVAKDENADLMVIGRRGAGLAERVLLGSVADRVAHHSDVPVLLVP